LDECVKRACVAAGIPWEELSTKDNGDGMRIIAPQTIDWGLFAGHFLDALLDELDRHNETTQEDGDRFELRAAFDAGDITHGSRAIGPPLVHTRRLIDAVPLKEALESTRGTLGVIASEFFFKNVVKQSSKYRPGEYRKVSFVSKETDGVAFIRVPGRNLPPEPPPEPRYRKFVSALGKFLGNTSSG
jgi:hypothetical protein